MRRIAQSLAVFSLSATALVGNALPAHAATVSCGDVITADTTLTNDVTCSGDGLLVLADVTLDLGGHTLAGQGSGIGISFENLETGERAPSARVIGGRITGFSIGIYAVVLDSLVIDRVHINHTDGAVVIPENESVSITRSEIVDNSTGLGGGFSSIISVSRSTISRNLVAATNLPNSTLNVDRSVIDSNGSIAYCSQGHVNFSDTRVTRNAGGISLFQCDPSSFIRVVYERNGGGIDASDMSFPTGLTISASRFANNTGPVATLNDVVEPLITGNVFVGNASAVSFDCAWTCPFIAATITGNRFVRSASDGLRISGGGAYTVTDNVAVRNAGWGIFVDPAVVVTASGNTASDNGMVGQCSGVPCG